MAAESWEGSPFQQVWAKALRKYADTLPPEKRVDLEDSKWLDIRDVKDLINQVDKENGDFDRDTSQGRDFAAALQGAFGPFQLLTNMFGGMAGAAFPPTSQILGAVSVLIAAGKSTAGAFDALGGLFQVIAAFVQRLQPLSANKISPELENIIQQLLTQMLEICALATRRTFHVEKDVKHWKRTRIIHTAQSKITEYFRMLLMGKDAEIDAAVGTFNDLVKQEEQMTIALTKRDTSEIKADVTTLTAVTVEVQGLSQKIRDLLFDVQTETTAIQFRLDGMEISQDEIKALAAQAVDGIIQANAGIVELKSGIGELKVAQRGEESRLKDMQERMKDILKLIHSPSDSSGQQSSAGAKSTNSEKERKKRPRLEALLQPSQLNTSYLEQITCLQGTGNWLVEHESTKRWMTGESPLMFVTGESGSGKTHLAARLIRTLQAPSQPATDQALLPIVAYFFCRQAGSEHCTVDMLLRSLAFQVTQNDPAYAAYILALFKNGTLAIDSEGALLVDSGSSTSGETKNHESSKVDNMDTQAVSNAGIDLSHESTAAISEAVQTEVPLPDTTKEASASKDGPSFKTICQTLFGDYVSAKTRPIFLVIDAVEECEGMGRAAFYEAICDLYTSRKSTSIVNMRTVFFSNSDENKVVKQNTTSNSIHLVIENSLNRSDVDLFIQEELKKAWAGQLISQRVFSSAQRSISGASNGNFLWASLVVEEITSLRREDIVLQSLENLPSDLSNAMLLVLDRLDRELDADDFHDLNDILAWVVCAQRPLTLKELDALLFIRKPEGSRVINLEERLQGSLAALFSLSRDETSTQIIEKEDASRLAASDESTDLDELGFLSDTVIRPQAVEEGKQDHHVDLETLNFEEAEDSRFQRQLQVMDGTNIRLGHGLPTRVLQSRQTKEGKINFATDRMQALVLQNCLLALSDKEPLHKQEAIAAAIGYAGFYISEHLEAVGPPTQDSPFREGVVKALLQLLRDEVTMERWVQLAAKYMTRDLLQNRNFVNLVLQWLTSTDANSCLAQEDIDFINKAQKEPIRVICGGLARMHARQWLNKRTDWPGQNYTFVNAYITLCETGDLKEAPDPNATFEWNDSSAERIIQVARWAEFEETATWCSRVAFALRDANKHEAAREFYDRGIALDVGNPLIFAGKAMSYASTDDFDLAIATMETATHKAQQNIADGIPADDPDISLREVLVDDLLTLAGLYVRKEQLDHSISTYQLALRGWETLADDKDFEAYPAVIFECLTTMIEADKVAEAAALMNRIADHPRSSSAVFLTLYTWLFALNSPLPRIALQSQRFDLLDRIHFHGWQVIKRFGSKEQQTWAKVSRGKVLLLIHQPRREKGLQILRSALVAFEAFPDSSPEMKYETKMILARALLDQILQAQESDQWQLIGRYAQELLSVIVPDTDDFDDDSLSNTMLILSVCYRINGRLSQARSYAKAQLKHGVDWLEDTDPDNDLGAWSYLADSLLAIGDQTRATTSVSMLRHVAKFGSGAQDLKDGDKTAATTTKETVDDSTNGQSAEPQAVTGANKLASTGNDNAGSVMDRNTVQPRSPDETQHSDALPDMHTNGTSKTSVDNKHETDGSEINIMPMQESSAVAAEDSSMPGEEPAIVKEVTDPIAAPENPGGVFYCDGPCFKTIPNEATFWRCSYCIVDLCEDCHALVKAGGHEHWRLCGRNHEHFQMSGVAEKFPDDKVPVGDGFVDLHEWLETLKKEWSL